MKSMKYKIDNSTPPSSSAATAVVAAKKETPTKESIVINLTKIESVNKSYLEDDDVYDDEDDVIGETIEDHEQIRDIVIMSSSSTSSSSSSEMQAKKSASESSVHSDTASSNESGFGTDDPECNTKQVDSATPLSSSSNQLNNNQYAPLQQNQQINLSPDNSPNQINSNDKQQQQQHQQQIKIPNIQGPRQIIYQLNGNSDDIANILNDNSSINSSSSSSSNPFNQCCSSLMEQLNRCYYSCFCCYSTTSNTNQTPFIWSWLSVFCCCCPILGCISLYLTNRSKKFKLKHKYDLAEKYSNYAEKLNIASLIFGVIFYAILFFLICIFIFMHWRQTKL